MSAASKAAPALSITDRTAIAATGLTWRQLRAFCLANGVPIAKAGRRSIVRADRYLEALDRAARSPVLPHWDEDEIIARAAGERP